MKMIKLFFLIITFAIVGCKQKCETPVCAKPNLNSYSDLAITFCINQDNCFSTDELNDVIFKEISEGIVIRQLEITNLETNNYSLRIGSKSNIDLPNFKFGPEPTGTEVLEVVEYDFEIEIPQISKTFRIDNLKLQSTEECNCLNYNFKSANLDGQEVEVLSNEIILKKEN